MSIFVMVDKPLLCFTANTANSSIGLCCTGTAQVTFESSTDGTTWNSYTINTAITLSNIWDKVFFRNTSDTDTGLSTNSMYYYFDMSWSIAASWDISYLLNKNWTKTIWNWCFNRLFYQRTSLTSTPSFYATTMGNYCCNDMFALCSNLTTLPKLPATSLWEWCYNTMFARCTNIKLSSTQTWEYQTEYRIPTSWTGTDWGWATGSMFYATWWTFTWTPSINTTYYTSNTLV